MKSPTTCPCCNGVLRNNFLDPNGVKVTRIEKICDKQINHQFRSYQYEDSDNIFAIDIEIDKESQIHAFFQLSTKTISIYKGNKLHARDALKLPYFEPDLSNYNKVVDKIRTYVLLS